MEHIDFTPRLHFEGLLDEETCFESPLAIPEIALYIFSYLDPKSLAKVQLTCRYWKMLGSDDILWRPLFFDIFPKSVRDYPNPPSYYSSFKNMLIICQGLENKEIEPRVKAIDCRSIIKVIQKGKDVFYTGSEEGTLKIWDREGALLNTISAHRRTITSLCPLPNGIASGSNDFTVRLWKKDEEESQNAFSLKCHKVIQHKNLVTSIKSQGETVFSIGWDGAIVETDNRESKEYPSEEKDSLRTLVYHENKIITGSWSGILQVIDRRTEEIQTVKAHQSLISGIQVYDNFIITCSWDRTLSVWDLETLERRYILWDLAKSDIRSKLSFKSKAKVLLLRDHQIICGLESGDIILYDFNEKKKHVLKGHKQTVTALQSYENGLISSSFDGTFRIWNLDKKLEINKIELDSPILCFEIGYGNIIANCKDKGLKIIEFNNRKRKDADELKPKRAHKKSRLIANDASETLKRD